MMGFRESYFEDHKAVPYTDARGKRRVRYVYTGDWCRWGADDETAAEVRRQYLLLEGAALAVYAWSATRKVPFNAIRPVSGLGILSLLCWMIALWGVAGFLFSGSYIREADKNSMEEKIRAGSLLHGLLMGTAAVMGIAILLAAGNLTLPDLAAAAGHLAAAALSLRVWQLQRRMPFRTYENKSGKAGREI